MKKMVLKIDDLRVDSFATSAERTRSGTVAAHESAMGTWCANTCETTCYEFACACSGGIKSCNVSCGGTCHQVETCAVEGCDFTNYNCPSGESRPGCC